MSRVVRLIGRLSPAWPVLVLAVVLVVYVADPTRPTATPAEAIAAFKDCPEGPATLRHCHVLSPGGYDCQITERGRIVRRIHREVAR